MKMNVNLYDIILNIDKVTMYDTHFIVITYKSGSKFLYYCTKDTSNVYIRLINKLIK